jgi:hypothetical protein
MGGSAMYVDVDVGRLAPEPHGACVKEFQTRRWSAGGRVGPSHHSAFFHFQSWRDHYR